MYQLPTARFRAALSQSARSRGPALAQGQSIKDWVGANGALGRGQSERASLMTFGEKRVLLHRFHVLAAQLRAVVNARPRATFDEPITVSRQDFDALQFGLAHMKVWVPELDEGAEVLPGKGRLVRSNFCFTLTGCPQENLAFKGVAILRGDS